MLLKRCQLPLPRHKAYLLPTPVPPWEEETWGAGHGMRGCGKEGRKPLAGVNNPGLWGKVKKATPCWILSVIPEGPSSLCSHPVLPNLTELCAMLAVITSVCQCIQVGNHHRLYDRHPPCWRRPAVFILHQCITGGRLNIFGFGWAAKCQLL